MEIGNQTHSFENSQNSMDGKYKRRKHLNHTTYRIRQLNCTVVLSTGISTVIHLEQDALEVMVNDEQKIKGLAKLENHPSLT